MTERDRLQSAIATLEAQREILGDDVVEASIAALRKQIADLEPKDERRKLVTVLFADLVGWTRMSEQMDPEEVREIQDAYIQAVTPPIHKFGGNVEKYIGDAVLAVFGVPLSHEDDPERAVQAALEMQVSLAGLNDDLGTLYGLQLSLRVGVNSGLVVSRVTGGAADFVVTGDTVNLASRLESAAPPGGVLISEATFRHVQELFDVKVLEPLTLKGKTEPVPVYQVLAVKSQVTKPRGITGLRSPLMGRTKEYNALQAALSRLAKGEGGVVTVVGEAGIGKSRLVADVRGSVGDGTIQWVEGRCLSYGGTIAYLPWLEILRALVGAGLEDNPTQVQEKLKTWLANHYSGQIDDVYPFLGSLLSLPLEKDVQESLDTIDWQARREGIFQAVECSLECAARQHPLVIVLEDLHWVDPSSLALLKQVIKIIRQVPLLIICAFRPHHGQVSWEQLEPAKDGYAELHTELKLNPLTVSESDGLLSNLISADGLPSELVERILSQAEGNPFYLEEVLRSLIDMQAIIQDGKTGRWQITKEINTISIPDTLQGVLIARIDRLERETRRLLQMAAVIGRTFLYRVLVAIAEQEHELDQKLLRLRREDLIREHNQVPELEYIFKHALTQEAAYNGILKKHRRTFHQQVAKALEDLFPERIDENLGLLAYHWERAKNAEKAVEYLLRAGDQARNLYAHQEAVDYYQRALLFLKEGKVSHKTARILMKLGLTYHNAFEYQLAREAYQEGFELWRAAEDESDLLIPSPHPLRIVVSDIRILDPIVEVGLATVRSHLFSGLLEMTSDMDVVPDVAHSWEVLDEGNKYIFHLREDVFWTDGEPVTADDFAYTFQKILDPATNSPSAELLYDIRGARSFHNGNNSGQQSLGIQTVNPHTLVLELEQTAAYFLQLMAVSYPVPRHAVEAYGEDWTDPKKIITNGPYMLENWSADGTISFVRNRQYHGEYKGNVNQVKLIVREWPPKSENLHTYEMGEADILNLADIPVTDVENALYRNGDEYVTAPELMPVIHGFNVRKPPFDKKRVRQAFALAFNQEDLVDKFIPGLMIPATGGFIPPGMPGHSPGIGLPYDPQRARQLLAEAGYADGHKLPPIVATTFPGHNEISAYIIQQWERNLGIEIFEDVLEWDLLINRLDEDPPQLWLGLGFLAEYPDPDVLLRVQFPWKETGWKNEICTQLIEKAQTIVDQHERMRLYAEAEQIMINEAAIIPMTYSQRLFLIKPWVKIYPLSAMTDSYWKDTVIEQH